MKDVAKELLKMGEFPSWWFNPNNVSARQPEDRVIKSHLAQIDPDLRLTWNPVKGVWQLWGKPDVQNRVTAERTYAEWSRGWRHLADLVGPDDKPMSLTCDNIDTMCAMAMAKTYGGAQAALQKEEQRAAAAKLANKKALEDNQVSWASEMWDHFRPMVGYGFKNNGSKFSNFG